MPGCWSGDCGLDKYFALIIISICMFYKYLTLHYQVDYFISFYSLYFLSAIHYSHIHLWPEALSAFQEIEHLFCLFMDSSLFESFWRHQSLNVREFGEE